MEVKYKLIDLSHHNGTVDFSKVKASGVQGVIIRAGYGNSNVDTKFHEYMQGAIAQGLHIGVYWFGYASTVAQAQTEAKLCIDTISQYKGKIDFPIYYDWEDDSYNYIKKTYGITATKQLVSNMTDAFCKYCESQGWWSGFYSNPNYLANYYTDTLKFRYALWVANYADKCSYTGSYGIWQYSEKGSVSGITGNVDLDYCYVDYPKIIKNGGFNGYSKSDTSTYNYDVNGDGTVDSNDLQALTDYLKNKK